MQLAILATGGAFGRTSCVVGPLPVPHASSGLLIRLQLHSKRGDMSGRSEGSVRQVTLVGRYRPDSLEDPRIEADVATRGLPFRRYPPVRIF